MKIALLAAMLAASLAGHVLAAEPTSERLIVGALAVAPDATPAYASTSAPAWYFAQFQAGRHGARARSNISKAFLGSEPETLCDKARDFCDHGSKYWCEYEDQHCDGAGGSF